VLPMLISRISPLFRFAWLVITAMIFGCASVNAPCSIDDDMDFIRFKPSENLVREIISCSEVRTRQMIEAAPQICVV